MGSNKTTLTIEDAELIRAVWRERGELEGRRKALLAEAENIRKQLSQMTPAALARKFGCSRGFITNIVNYQSLYEIADIQQTCGKGHEWMPGRLVS